MIEWLQNNLDSIPKEPEEGQDSGSEKSEEEVISPEEQAKIDNELAARAKHQGGARAPVCAEVYG